MLAHAGIYMCKESELALLMMLKKTSVIAEQPK
jgi:hypothetical protein